MAVAVSGDEAGHPCPVAVAIGAAVGGRIRHVGSGEDCSYEVGVVGLHSGVNLADDDTVALAVLLGLVDVEERQMPLQVADAVGLGGRGNAEGGGGDGNAASGEAVQPGGHPSMPITPGPGSRYGPGPASKTGLTPLA